MTPPGSGTKAEGRYSGRPGRMPYWTAVLTQPNCEAKAVENIDHQGFPTYLPKTVEIDRCGLNRVVNLFPRYVLVDVARGGWGPLRHTRGVSGLVYGAGSELGRVSDKEIAKLRSMEDRDGVIRELVLSRFEVGQSVLVTRGPFASSGRCIFNGMRGSARAQVLLQMMGGQVPLELNEADLVAA